MAVKRIHTPEGVRDIYGEECARKLAVQGEISRVFHLYGCQDIETPTFEFFDIFNKERGSVGDREMYKFFDRDNNTLVLRPDMTPAVARCVAKYFMEETMPVRFCYRERTFINNSSYQGRLKETTQTGVELIGDGSVDADAEMIAMVIDALKAAGLKEFQVELGQVEFFQGLAEEAKMEKETQETLRELIEKKNYFGVEELITAQTMPEELKAVFLKLPELFGSMEEISRVKTMTKNPRALYAIERLEKIQELLKIYGLADYVSYDLGMLSKYQYYTGLIFKAYTYGMGEYIVTGGRYDKLLEQFGKEAPAVGFVIVVDSLMLALSRQKLEVPVDRVYTMVLYEACARRQAVEFAMGLRRSQVKTELIRRLPETELDGYLAFARKNGLSNLFYLKEAGDMAQLFDTIRGSSRELRLSDYAAL